ncbi:hypothetical protein QFZ24_005491 [Streptomyces phaeochromogenes]|jgi:hypothetical protein|nr:hypothetical protein [Streptomyces phaeochromogenes]
MTVRPARLTAVPATTGGTFTTARPADERYPAT